MKVATDGDRCRMGGGIPVFGDGQGPAELVGRLGDATLLIQQGAETVGDEGDLGVVGTEELFFHRQRLAVQPLGALGLPTFLFEGGQVVELDGHLVAARRPAGLAGDQGAMELAACLVVVASSGEHRREYRLVSGENTRVRARRAAQRHRSARVPFALFVPPSGVGQSGEVVLQVGQLRGGGTRLVPDPLDPRVQVLRLVELADLLAGDGQGGQRGGEQVRLAAGGHLACPLERLDRLRVPSGPAVSVTEAGQRSCQERPLRQARGRLGVEQIHQPSQTSTAARPFAAPTLDFRDRERHFPGQLDRVSLQQQQCEVRVAGGLVEIAVRQPVPGEP